MTKKNLGKVLTLTAISTAIIAGVSYFLKYRSFHAELDEDFHDFEGDEDDIDETSPHEEEIHRNYVPIGEKKEESSLEKAAEDMKEAAKETVQTVAEKAEDTAEKVKEETLETAKEVKEGLADAAKKTAETIKDTVDTATITIEDDIP